MQPFQPFLRTDVRNVDCSKTYGSFFWLAKFLRQRQGGLSGLSGNYELQPEGSLHPELERAQLLGEMATAEGRQEADFQLLPLVQLE